MARARKRRQKSKYLGKRTFGCGNVKNKRGSGNRGGRGNAGRCKHKGSWVVNNEPDYFGKFGFKNPTRKEMPVVHLYDINRRAALGQLEKRGERFAFSFEGKVLSTGEVTLPLSVRALAWSGKVEEKLKQKGGEIAKLGEKG